MENSEWNNSTL